MLVSITTGIWFHYGLLGYGVDPILTQNAENRFFSANMEDLCTGALHGDANVYSPLHSFSWPSNLQKYFETNYKILGNLQILELLKAYLSICDLV